MAWRRRGLAIGLLLSALVAFPAWAAGVWRSFGNDAVGATLVEMNREGDRLVVRLEVENLSEGDRLFVHHAPEERDPQTYTFLPPRNRQAPSTDFRQLSPLATGSWEVSFFLPKGTRPGLLVIGEARSPYRQAAILLDAPGAEAPQVAFERTGALVPPLPARPARPATGPASPGLAAATGSGAVLARSATPLVAAVPRAPAPAATADPRPPVRPTATPAPRPVPAAVASPAPPRPLASPMPRPTASPAPGEIAYISLSGSARKARLPRPTVQPRSVAAPTPSTPPPVAMLPALPAGDRYVAAMRPGFAGIGDLLVLRLGVAPSASGGGYGWRRIRVEAPGVRLDDLASAVDAPDVVAVSGRSWLLAREVGERWVVVQTDGTLVVAARLAQREDVRAWTGPGGPYSRVLRGALP